MCTNCGCADKPVVINAPVRTSYSDRATIMNGATIGSKKNTSVKEESSSVIAGFNVPTPYGKGAK